MRPVDWSTFTADVAVYYAPPQRSPNTFGKVKQVLRLFNRFVRPLTTADIGPVAVSRFVLACEGSGLAGRTIHGYLGYLAPVFKLAVHLGYCDRSPFDLRPPSQWVRASEDEEDEPEKRHLTREQVARLLVWTEARAHDWRGLRLHALVALLAYTGLRRNEALTRKVADVDLTARVVIVRSRRRARLKTRASAAPVPIPEALLPVLAKWLPETGAEWLFPNVSRSGPWTGGNLRDRPLGQLHAAGEAAGVGRVTFAMLRHTFATMAESWGIGELMLQRVLRHTTTRTQRHYRHVDVANMTEAVRDIRYHNEDHHEDRIHPPIAPRLGHGEGGHCGP